MGGGERHSRRSGRLDRNAIDWKRFDPRRYLGMLVVATRLGSLRARAALSFILFLVIWLLLSVPDAFAATVTRSSSFTYDAASGLLLTETVEPGDPQLGVATAYWS